MTAAKQKKKKRVKPKCEAKTPLCSGQAVATYGVNGSEKEGTTFKLCLACAAAVRMGGSRLKNI